MEVTNVAVVGAGTMGSSIAVALISNGIPVLLKEVNEELLEKGMSNIDRIQQKRISKGTAEDVVQAEMARLTTTTKFDQFAEVDLVIEAAPESMEIKKQIFEDLDEYTNVNAILATNTSSLSITRIAAFTRRPDKVIGLHFFNPAHLMKLVEVIPGLETSTDTISTGLELGKSLGKLAIQVDECPSFLVNRLLGRYMNESLWCLVDEVADIETIDRTAKEFVVPIGPLALRDMNGADIGLAVANFNHQEYGTRYEVPPILEKMVQENLLGRKTGCGFYNYDPETRKATGPNEGIYELAINMRGGRKKRSQAPTSGKTARSKRGSKSSKKNTVFSAEQLFLPLINEAFLALQERVCAPADLDPAMMAGIGMRRGPLKLAEEIGLADCLRQTEECFELYGERFRPAPLLKRFVWSKRTSIF